MKRIDIGKVSNQIIRDSELSRWDSELFSWVIYSLDPSGLQHHKLGLKVVAPIMLLKI